MLFKGRSIRVVTIKIQPTLLYLYTPLEIRQHLGTFVLEKDVFLFVSFLLSTGPIFNVCIFSNPYHASLILNKNTAITHHINLESIDTPRCRTLYPTPTKGYRKNVVPIPLTPSVRRYLILPPSSLSVHLISRSCTLMGPLFLSCSSSSCLFPFSLLFLILLILSSLAFRFSISSYFASLSL